MAVIINNENVNFVVCEVILSQLNLPPWPHPISMAVPVLLAPSAYPPEHAAWMKRIKPPFNPNGVLNPGKIFPQ